ncbi:phage terminase large subunit [uncultured Paenibacillus sp.]|uniref:phage terminase large subunit n=1 Tax=uncultured Paenibacillus sp. TaxID=227322 RepID=UPI00205887E9|nr:phage terminase large subunit [uncultured Paenibacillus sp.]DAW22586.1 MAG TPA: Large Terminase [Caudoviricetes sp.]
MAALSPDDATEIDVALTEYERLERINRCETDLIEFALEYFSEARNPGNDGNWDGFDITGVSEAPEFHREIAEIIDDVSNVHTNDKVAVAAPRSHAKSTYLSKAAPLREICYRKRKYEIIISETPAVSSANLDWIAAQLKGNAKLRADFGPLLSPKQQENPKDNSSEFIAWEPREDGTKKLLTKVEAASTGQALRGRNWNGVRPDLIICDDLEDIKSNAATPELRRKLKDWFAQTVVPLGDPRGKKTAFIYMGTTVHHEALLVDVLYNRSDFKSRVYRAVIEWPERMDLWEACRLVYKDPDRPKEERVREAEELYEANRAEMDRGAVVLWPDAQPIWKLMRWKWDNGSKAFNTEYMNNPIDEESMIFNPETFAYWDGGPLSALLTQYPRPTDAFDVYMGVDFAMGKTRGDYSAIVVIARHRESGTKYVIDAFGERIKPDAFLRVIVEKAMRYQPNAIAAEAQAAQEFFVMQLKDALRAAGYPGHTRVKEIHQRSRKDLRIEALLPDIESGAIQFSRKHALLLEQFELYGTGSHDDLPDALEMAVSIAKSGRKKIRNKPAWAY